MAHQYHIVSDGDRKTLTVFVPSSGLEGVHTVAGDHPNYDALIEAAEAGADNSVLAELADIGQAVEQRFQPLSDRVSVNSGAVYFDGDEVHGVIVDHILRCLEVDADFQPLVSFLDNVQANPVEHSREQLYDWLQATGGFTITQDGMIVGYKGVNATTEDGVYESLNSGEAIVNGVTQNGRIRQSVGDVVTMPRSGVNHDPSQGCSVGLHVGTVEYAKGYARNGALLKVLVDPRDVVSVPNDCSHAKMRTCRYVIESITDGADAAPIAGTTAAPTGLDLVQDEDDRAMIAGALGVSNIEFEYVDGDGTESSRDVDPDTIKGDCLIGWDHHRADYRQFNLARISSVGVFDAVHRADEDDRRNAVPASEDA